MCDKDHFAEDAEIYEKRGLVTRRQFGILLGAGVAMMLPSVAGAVTVTESEVMIKTPDGTCDAYFVHPSARTAATVPDRVGAVASFHGGGLVTQQPNSPHLQAAKTKAQFLIAIAESDDKPRPMEKDVLKKTFEDAKLPAEIEVYGAAHGWCPPDSTVYNEPLAEKAWGRLLALYGKAL